MFYWLVILYFNAQKNKPKQTNKTKQTNKNIPTNGECGKIADPVVNVIEERGGTGEEVAGRSETLDELGAVRALRVLAYCFSHTVTDHVQARGEDWKRKEGDDLWFECC